MLMRRRSGRDRCWPADVAAASTESRSVRMTSAGSSAPKIALPATTTLAPACAACVQTHPRQLQEERSCEDAHLHIAQCADLKHSLSVDYEVLSSVQQSDLTMAPYRA